MSSLAFGPGGLTAISAVSYRLNRRCAGKPEVFLFSLAKTTKTKWTWEKYSLVEIFSR